MNYCNWWKKLALIAITVACLLSLCGCKDSKNAINNDTTIQDDVANKISFGKKYYFLNGTEHVKDEYYLFNEDGSASYNFTYLQNGKVTLKMITNFRWTYAGEDKFILLHNGTEIVTGVSDGITGFGRIMHTTKDVMYWDDNMFFICEDAVDKIPNYNKFVNAKELSQKEMENNRCN